MRKKILLFLIVFVLKVGYGFNLRIAPTGFAEKLDRPVSRLVYVYNETKEPMRVMVGIEDDERSADYGLKDSIKVFPKVLTIPPKGKRTARFRIDPQGLEDGEYKSYLYFKEMGKEKTRKEIIKEVKEDEIGINIKMLTNMGIAIYGYVGDIIPGVEIIEDSISKQGDKWILDVTGRTTGNCSMTVIANVKYLDDSGNEIGTEAVSGRINRGGVNSLKLKLIETPTNTKKIDVTYLKKDGQELRGRSYSFEL